MSHQRPPLIEVPHRDYHHFPLPSKTAMVEEKKEEKRKRNKGRAAKDPHSYTRTTLTNRCPYFAYFRSVNQVYQLVVMDADGTGRKVIDLPQEAIQSFPNNLSNDYPNNFVEAAKNLNDPYTTPETLRDVFLKWNYPVAGLVT